MSSAPNHFQILGTLCFAGALLHTFFASRLRRLAHWAGEVELAFAFWAFLFLSLTLIFRLLGTAAFVAPAVSTYLSELSPKEPLFVFTVLLICATRPVLAAVSSRLESLSRRKPEWFYFLIVGVAPLFGSLITEPAAMTLAALLLRDFYFRSRNFPERFKVASVGLLFVNVSIGGTLTAYAAPPVLMVADAWGWSSAHMLLNFGWKAALACTLSAGLLTLRARRDLNKISLEAGKRREGLKRHVPFWLSALHFVFLFGVVWAPTWALAWLVGFLILFAATKRFQTALMWKQAALVGLFLFALVILGGPQRWWIELIFTRLNELTLYLGSIGLTAFVDNTAITYLGSQVQSLTETSRYALVAGSVVGGGLTVIANAPNPIGFSLLEDDCDLGFLNLLGAALVPTAVAAVCFWAV